MNWIRVACPGQAEFHLISLLILIKKYMHSHFSVEEISNRLFEGSEHNRYGRLVDIYMVNQSEMAPWEWCKRLEC